MIRGSKRFYVMWGESPKEHFGWQLGAAPSEDTSVKTDEAQGSTHHLWGPRNVAPKTFSEVFLKESFDKQEDWNTICVSYTLKKKKCKKMEMGASTKEAEHQENTLIWGSLWKSALSSSSEASE